MTKLPQTVTLHFPLANMPAIITRLTTYLLQHHYVFLQTCYDVEHMGFDIFTQQDQPVIRLTMQATDNPGLSSEALASAMSQSLTAEARQVLQHLLQTD